MRTAEKLLLLGNRAAVTWSSYITSTLAPVAWYRFRETSGTNAANSGSGGAALDMTIVSSTVGQTGQLGANEAYLLDGANSRLQTANNAALASLTTWEYVFLVNPSSAGEGSFGALFTWGQATNEPIIRFNAAITAWFARVANTTPTNFDTTTSTALAASTWQMVFIAYDDAGDRKIHIYKGVSGAVTECAYLVQPALTGTYKTPTSALNLFNVSNQSGTFAGLGDEVLIKGTNLSAAQRLRLVQLAGV